MNRLAITAYPIYLLPVTSRQRLFRRKTNARGTGPAGCFDLVPVEVFFFDPLKSKLSKPGQLGGSGTGVGKKGNKWRSIASAINANDTVDVCCVFYRLRGQRISCPCVHRLMTILGPPDAPDTVFLGGIYKL